MSDLETHVTDYSDVPEVKSLLPPLPDTCLKTPTKMNIENGYFESDELMTSPHCYSVTSTPPRRSASKSTTVNMTPSTPLQAVTPRSGIQYSTPKSLIATPGSPFDHLQSTPQGNQTTVRNTHTTSSPFSPVIPIDDRFGVSIAEPDIINEPSSPLEKLRHFEMCQKTQDAEFHKTCESLKKSGWMSQKEILQLERAKEENWCRWEEKVKAAKREVTLAKGDGRYMVGKGLNSHQKGDSSDGSTRKNRNGLGIRQ